ncbi:MAG: dUTP diphosphatase [Candidatus Peribacteraceae bacterium]|nr:dUTP diphosphatase [Candidatus Peribacteraceae bacterium]
MKVKIFRIDKDLPLPIYETAGAVGFDLLARKTTEIEAGEIKLIPANVIVATPPGFALLVTSRSSTPRKKGLTQPHGLGVIDQDYCGSEDELKIQVHNFSGKKVTVERGEKIAQGLFVRCERAEFEEIEKVENQTRGGFGSTDS